mmetsp:Transcript_22088/g.51348  ORF Transcript_22088/g.51348 Transcript_22088/m.51348 type:complete len:209 (+) Transcript_22088:131-757(+)
MARAAAMHKIEQELEQQCLACKVQYDPPPTRGDNTARRARRRRLRNTCISAEQLGDAIDVPAVTPLTGSRQKKWRDKQRPARDDARQANLLEQHRLAEHDLEARCADCGADYVSAPDREDESNRLKRWDNCAPGARASPRAKVPAWPLCSSSSSSAGLRTTSSKRNASRGASTTNSGPRTSRMTTGSSGCRFSGSSASGCYWTANSQS